MTNSSIDFGGMIETGDKSSLNEARRQFYLSTNTASGNKKREDQENAEFFIDLGTAMSLCTPNPTMTGDEQFWHNDFVESLRNAAWYVSNPEENPELIHS